MTDKVVHMNGEEFTHKTGEPVAAVVEVLEIALENAKKGETLGIMLIERGTGETCIVRMAGYNLLNFTALGGIQTLLSTLQGKILGYLPR